MEPHLGLRACLAGRPGMDPPFSGSRAVRPAVRPLRAPKPQGRATTLPGIVDSPGKPAYDAREKSNTIQRACEPTDATDASTPGVFLLDREDGKSRFETALTYADVLRIQLFRSSTAAAAARIAPWQNCRGAITRFALLLWGFMQGPA